jgi:hypothetical protein
MSYLLENDNLSSSPRDIAFDLEVLSGFHSSSRSVIVHKSILSSPSDDSECSYTPRSQRKKSVTIIAPPESTRNSTNFANSVKNFNSRSYSVPTETHAAQRKRHIRPNGVSVDQLDLSSLLSTSSLNEEEFPSSRSLDSSLPNQDDKDTGGMSPAHYKHMMRCRALKGL